MIFLNIASNLLPDHHDMHCLSSVAVAAVSKQKQVTTFGRTAKKLTTRKFDFFILIEE
jgi:hypothetical protein